MQGKIFIFIILNSALNKILLRNLPLEKGQTAKIMHLIDTHLEILKKAIYAVLKKLFLPFIWLMKRKSTQILKQI